MRMAFRVRNEATTGWDRGEEGEHAKDMQWDFDLMTTRHIFLVGAELMRNEKHTGFKVDEYEDEFGGPTTVGKGEACLEINIMPGDSARHFHFCLGFEDASY